MAKQKGELIKKVIRMDWRDGLKYSDRLAWELLLVQHFILTVM